MMRMLHGSCWALVWSLFLNITASLGANVANTFQIGQNFTGTVFGQDSDSSPADGNGAAGLQHFVELSNGRFTVYDKSTGSRVQSMTDLRFWNTAGLNFSSTVGTTDPRIIFDAGSQRWFASMVDFVINRPSQRSNHYLLAVSESSDPTGSWNAFSFATDTNRVDFADFPTLGADANGVYLSGDMFDRLGNPLGPSLVSIPKTSLLATPPTVAGLTYLGTFTYSSRGDILQPAISTGTPTTPEIIVAVGDLGIDFQPHTTLVLSTILNGGSTNATLASPATVLDVPAYTVPINPPQPDGTDTLDNGDARLGSSVRRVGDVVYATHAVQVGDRAAVRWYKINAVNHTLIESDTIADPNLDLFYPSIAANETGTVVIGCNASSPNVYVSSYAMVGQTVNGSLTFGVPTLLKAGSASYHNLDISGTSRWGDYSATTVDPVDPTRFWTIQMIAVGTSTWATQITEILTGGTTPGGTVSPPTLTATRSGSNLVISWPTANADGYQLQSAASLDVTNSWMLVNQAPVAANGTNSLVLPTTGTAGFFRLVNATNPPANP